MKRYLLPLSVCLLFVNSLAATVDNPELRSILENHIRAIGGRAPMNAIQTISSRGYVEKETGREQITVVRKRPNQIRLNLRSDTTVTICYNGVDAWLMMDEDGKRTYPDISKNIIEGIKRDAIFWPAPSNYEDTMYTFERLDDAELDDRPQIVLAVKVKGLSGRSIYYLDADTYLISQNKTEGPDISNITEYKDYRPVEGVLLPFTIISKENDKDVTIHFKSIDLNKGVFDSYFLKP